MSGSIRLAEAASRAGVTRVVATPHCADDGSQSASREQVLEGVALLNRELQDRGIDLTVLPGSEAWVSANLIERYREGQITSLNDGCRYLLLEWSDYELPRSMSARMFELRAHSLTPIIAHPERNVEVQDDPNVLYRFARKGLVGQVNACSLVHGEAEVQKAACILVETGMVELLGSDCHSADHGYDCFLAAQEKLTGLVGADRMQSMVSRAPARVVQGRRLPRRPKRYRLSPLRWIRERVPELLHPEGNSRDGTARSGRGR
jgi:protein-tyrosine phosphatase